MYLFIYLAANFFLTMLFYAVFVQNGFKTFDFVRGRTTYTLWLNSRWQRGTQAM